MRSDAVFDLAAEFLRCQEAALAYREVLDRHLASTPALAADFAADMRAEGLDYGPNRLLCNTFRPHLLTAALHDHVAHVVTALTAAMHRLARQAIDDGEMLDALGVTEAERSLIAVPPGYDDLSALSRLDTFVSSRGLHLVEYNAECPTGVGYNQRLFRVFDRLPPMASFRDAHPLDCQDGAEDVLQTLLACWREWGGQGTPRIGIVDWAEVVTRGEFEIFAAWFRARGFDTVIIDPRALELREGRLYGEGSRIDLVYRRLLTAEFIERIDECRVFETAYRSQAACFVNSFRTKLLHKKLVFSLFTDPRWARLLTDEERSLAQAHVPWTARLRKGKVEVEGEIVDMAAWALANRADLVLKPNDDYGGKGLLLGSEATPRAWADGLDAALAGGDWVLQRSIPLLQASFPDLDGHWDDYWVDLDPFFYRQRMFGYMSRMSRKRVSNVSTGGGQMPTYVLR